VTPKCKRNTSGLLMILSENNAHNRCRYQQNLIVAVSYLYYSISIVKITRLLISIVFFVEQETSFSSCDDVNTRRLASSSSPLVLLPGEDELDYSYSNGNESLTTYTTASTVLDTPDRKQTDGKVLKLNELRLPLDKTDYLQPQSYAPATYLDLELNSDSTDHGKVFSQL